MVRIRTARGSILVDGTVRVNLSGVLAENRSPDIDDDLHVSVLRNLSVTGAHFQHQVFQHAVRVLFVAFSARQALVEHYS